MVLLNDSYIGVDAILALLFGLVDIGGNCVAAEGSNDDGDFNEWLSSHKRADCRLPP